jgi:hypothetical protein
MDPTVYAEPVGRSPGVPARAEVIAEAVGAKPGAVYRVSADTKPTELRLALTSNTAL